MGTSREGAAQQADEADEALGGTRLAIQDRLDGGAASCPRGQNGRGHRFAAYPRCSADVGSLTNTASLGVDVAGTPKDSRFQHPFDVLGSIEGRVRPESRDG
jgi:hypothetical protein